MKNRIKRAEVGIPILSTLLRPERAVASSSIANMSPCLKSLGRFAESLTAQLRNYKISTKSLMRDMSLTLGLTILKPKKQQSSRLAMFEMVIDFYFTGRRDHDCLWL
jgi:hypothetical protein